MRFFVQKYPPPVMWAAALAGSVLAVGGTRIADFDIWWHLRTGELIWKWQQVPKFDFFSYTARGAPWFNHEWLFQVISWLACYKWDLAALTVMKLACTAAITCAAFRTTLVLTSSRVMALWGSILLLWSIADRVAARPHIFTHLFVAVFCLTMHRFELGRIKALWSLPILTVIWANMHGGGILAPQIVFAFAVGSAIQARLTGPAPLTAGQRRHLWLVAGLCAAACLLNPFGIDIYLFPVHHMNMEAILLYTQEWLPTLDPRLDWLASQVIFRVTVIALLTSYIINRRNARISHLMLTALASVLVVKSKRFIPDFMIINLKDVVHCIRINTHQNHLRAPLKTLMPAARGKKQTPETDSPAKGLLFSPGGGNNSRFLEVPLHSWMSILVAAAISLYAVERGVPLEFKTGYADPIGLGTTEEFAPIRMIKFLSDNKIGGRVFNDMALGGYLIFSRWPGELVFIDGRTPVYGNDFYRTYIDAFYNSRNFEELDRLYSFDYLVFKGLGAWEVRGFHRYLWEDKKWRLVYMERDGIVYLRDQPKSRELIQRLELRRNPLVEEMQR